MGIGSVSVAVGDIGTRDALGACGEDPTNCRRALAGITMETGAVDIDTAGISSIDTSRTLNHDRDRFGV